MKKTIWVHTLVKNEERYLWFAVMSVIDWVDKIMLWDTGSTDQTVKIIKEIMRAKPGKVDFQEVGDVDPAGFTKIRQDMLDQTQADWLLVVDGDEVWWEESIQQVVKTIHQKGDRLETIVSPYYNIIGDIYHYQEQTAGQYQIDDLKGHYNIRAINRNIPGLHLEKPHGQQGFYDDQGLLIQNRPKKYRFFLNAPYLHFTNMRRSSVLNDQKVPKRSAKFKYEIGIPFPKNFRYPEVFYQPYPHFIPSPWQTMSLAYFIRAVIETGLKKIKRRICPSAKIGY